MPEQKGRHTGSGRPGQGRSGNPAVRHGSQPAKVSPPKPSKPKPSPRRTPVPANARSAEPPPAFMPTNVLPVDGAPYPLILRNESYAGWRSILGAVCALSLFVLMVTLIPRIVIVLTWSVTAGDQPYADYFASAMAFERPAGMLAANLGLISLIPIAYLMIAVVHQVKPRWLSSVGPRLRWRYLLICAGVALVALNGAQIVSWLVVERPAFGMQPGFLGFLVIILLTSPIQAAAEEYLFRGYLMQALGSLVTAPWFGVVVSAVVFAMFHGTQNVPLFVNRLAFGLLAGFLVWRTGGLEAGIAAHVVNNVCAYVIAGLTGSIAELKATRTLTWLESGIQIGAFALFAGLAWGIARRVRLRTRVDLPGVSA